jgi:hypothetical protein
MMSAVTACTGVTPVKVPDVSDSDAPIDDEPADGSTDSEDTPSTIDTAILIDDTDLVVDADADGLPDVRDNCPEYANPDQEDLDEDGIGDICDEDEDNDGVPNEADPWRRDPRWPGRVSPESIYPHTATGLFRFQVNSLAIDAVGTFTFDQESGNVTDIAIDQYGVLYAITSSNLFVCQPDSADCRFIATLPDFSIGLTFVPPGTLGTRDVLVGTGDSDWYRMDVSNGTVVSTSLGAFDGDGTTSSGDGFSIQGLGTFVSVNLGGDPDQDSIVQVDAATGQIQREILTFDDGQPHSRVYGLAGWTDGFIYGFDASGDILRVDVTAGSYEVLQSTPHSWWGAGVRTVVPASP